jgi:hypothetical protein
MIWLRRARLRPVGLLWKLWAFLFALLVLGIYVGATSKARAHGDLMWPAEFVAANGAKCCTGLNAHGRGDCVRLSEEFAAFLKKGSKVWITYPNGTSETTVTDIFASQEDVPVICSPGCLFKRAGV